MTGRRQAPHNVRVLQRWLTEVEASTGVAVARQQRWVSFMVVAAMLDQVRDENEQPMFLLKGGVALELRLGLHARATRDYDAAFRSEMPDLVDNLDEVLRTGYGDFSAERSELEKIGETQAQRTTIKLSYRGRSWASVKFEVAPAEGNLGNEIDRVPARPLDHLGLDGPVDVACMAVRWQIAQKLHACTEPTTGDRRNDRFRDLVDLILMWDLVDEADRPTVRQACEEIFELRAAHVWPPRVSVRSHWPAPYRVMAEELRFPILDVHEAAQSVSDIVEEIQSA